MRRNLWLLVLLWSVALQAQTLIDVDLGAGPSTTKTGPAAIGFNANDFWNFYTRDDGQGGWLTLGGLDNLKYSDGTASSAGIIVINAPGAWGNGSPDPMFDGYLYPFGGNATINVTHLPAGSYDFFLYGNDAAYQVTVDGADFGSKATTNAPITNPVVWQEGAQYVSISNVTVSAGQSPSITVRPGVSGYAVISGFQIAQSSNAPPASPPTITSQPASASVGIGSNVTFKVLASGGTPFTYQWYYNGATLPGAASYILALANVQTSNSGPYQVVVSNPYGSATSSIATLTVSQQVPVIVTQPHDQTVDAGATASFSVEAAGAPTLAYQWRRNGLNLGTATRSSLTVSNAQSANAGAYTVRVYNRYGAVTSSVATLTVNGSAPQITAQPVGGTVGSGTNFTFTVHAIGTAPLSYQWRLNGASLAAATKSFLALNNIQASQAGNYSVVVSNSIGTATSDDAPLTVYTVNHAPTANSQSFAVNQGASAAITLTGSDPDGDALTFAVVIPPAHGSLTGTAPDLSYQPNAGYAGSDSFTFEASDGQVDSPAATVSILVLGSQGSNSLIDVDFGAGTSTGETGPAAIGHSSSDFWNFYTRDDGHGGWLTFGSLGNLKTVEGMPTAAGLTIANAPGSWGNGSSDAMYASYVYPFDGGNVTVNVTNLDAGAYDIYVYGIDSHYQLAVGSTSYGNTTLPGGPVNNPVMWQEGLQYVVFRNVAVGSGQTMVLSASPGAGGYATLSGMQLIGVVAGNHAPIAQSQSVNVIQDTSKAITLSGSDADHDPLTYTTTTSPTHGALSGSGPNLTYTPATGFAGSDSFAFTVNDGQVDSAVATVSISVLPAGGHTLVNVDFGAGTSTSEAGPAATGHGGTDFWNFYTRDDGSGGWRTAGALANLRTAEGLSTLAGLTVLNAPGAWGNGSSDPMYDSYIYPFDGGNVTISVTNLDAGAYDIYVYGIDSSYEASVNGASAGAESLPAGPISNPVVWQQGSQYVVFRNIVVNPGNTLLLTVRPGSSGYATISGMQITSVETGPPVAPSFTQQPASQTAPQDSDVTFTVVAAGSSPLTYQWRRNGTDLSGATRSALSLHHVGFTDAGDYSVRVSNTAGSILSSNATLTVTAVNHRPVADPQSVVVAQNASAAITLTGTDSDSDPLTYAVVTPPQHGALSGTSPNLSYQPSASYAGSDSFTFAVNDGKTDSVPATVSITVLTDIAHALIDVDFGAGQGPSSEVGPAAIGQSGTDFWNFYTRDDPYGNYLSSGALAQLKFADGSQSGAGFSVDNAPGAWGNGSADPMYDGYLYPFNGGNVTVTTTNLPTGQYDLYVYGIDSRYRISVGGSDYGTKPLPAGPISNPVVWQEGLQFVVFRHVQISNGGQPLVLTVLPGNGGYATLSGLQIAGVTPTNHVAVASAQTVSVAQDASRSITLTGSDLDGDALTYTVATLPAHGTLTGTAPNLTYAPLSGYSGSDSFTFTVNDGQIDSVPATVTINVIAAGSPHLINVDFGAGTSTTKTGLASTGVSSSDFWNFYTRDDGQGGWLTLGALSDLKNWDNTSSGAGLTVANAPGAWGDGSSDPMYDSYIYPLNGGDVTVTVTNLAAGAFDIYLYGPDGNYQVTAGTVDYGTKATANAAVTNPVVWHEGEQYVLFHNVTVANPGDAVTLTVHPGQSGYATLSGLQISAAGTSNPPTNSVPTAHAQVQPSMPPVLGSTNLFVVSANGSNALVVLDGLLSVDPNHDPLSYHWLANSLTPFATGVATTNIFDVGVHTVTVVVSDGKATSTATVQFEVLTVASAVAELAAGVEQSALSRTVKRQLEEVLLDNSGNSDALNLLAFQNKVQSYVTPVAPAVAADLQNAAQHILDSATP